MGCDIHIYTEAFRNNGGKEMWLNVDNWKLNHYYDAKNPDGEREYDIAEIYGDRNYGLFAILAGVRDYSGKTVPIAEPKGLPKDISIHTRIEAERWDGDGHSHSYFTLKEIKDYLKTNPKLHRSGLITQAQARLLDNEGVLPTTWCQGSSDKTMVYREWIENETYLEPLVEEMTKRMKEEFYVWGDDYKEELESKYRIVFWFDN